MLERLKNLLHPPEAKSSRTARLIALESLGRPRWTPRDYAALAREGYLGNAIVHRTVKLVAENAAACVFLLYDGAVERDTHALLDNSARPSGALVYDGPEGAVLSDNQFERLKRELEDNYQGAVNAGRPLLLEGGLDWKAMSLSPKDMEFLEAKHTAAREIALAFGVPPMLLGIPGDNTFSNYQEANRVFFRATVLPFANRIGCALAQWLAPAFGADLRLAIDIDRIDALATDRAALWERATAAPFLTINEKRAATGYGPLEGGDRFG